jgi:hypothetical protein
MEMLDIDELPSTCRFRPDQTVMLECTIEQSDIDDNATEIDPEMIEPDLTDLREGLEALRSGDIAMARILLDRAFDDRCTDTRKVIEAALRPMSPRRAA